MAPIKPTVADLLALGSAIDEDVRTGNLSVAVLTSADKAEPIDALEYSRKSQCYEIMTSRAIAKA
jgi:hypothetical protein